MENIKTKEIRVSEEFIEKHIPFIISCISKFTGRYVSIENDDEYSIGMIAFVEAIEKYKEEKGDFKHVRNCKKNCSRLFRSRY